MSFPTPSPAIVCSDLSFAWTDGTPMFEGLDVAIGAGRTGLVGVNGAGKSTLLKLIAGVLRPAGGSIAAIGDVGYLPQHLPLDADRRVDDVLGIAEARAGLLAIESGDVDAQHFEAVGDDWDVEERARGELDRLGLPHVDLDRTVGTLSGGEAILLGLAAQLLRRPDVLLLDEPTNNLDRSARERLYDAVRTYPGVLVVVSHDRALLDLVERIVELLPGRARTYGGNLTAYLEVLAQERETAERLVRTAQTDLRKQKKELAEAQVRLARRLRSGRKAAIEKRVPKIVAGNLKRAAEVSAGKYKGMHEDRLDDARTRLTDAQDAVREDKEIRIELPETEVPAGRTVLTLEGVNTADDLYGPDGVDLIVRGPERIALVGDNGSGKTTLLRLLTGLDAPARGTVRVDVEGVRYLPQRLDILDEDACVLENVRRFAPSASDEQLRGRLARFLFKGDRPAQPVGTLSGGERFRAVLVALLSAEPAPRLLVLDEPTNNLDMASVHQLEQALHAYKGALLLATHDQPFLTALGITRTLTLTRGNTPTNTTDA
ncbi:ABC-F family ATP-binding cassette domain-containing protein [Embleya sp. NBC_00896]|uniref:ABC-F family ATP-binding cassette domain-containing protein n=1 Tax=Embleya sp. NBC_00896 TaxID=2975961 RepID=UPI00386CF4FE|nr:ATP-binding cassette domain-containing protein [Embleya sp. NBC_00896]